MATKDHNTNKSERAATPTTATSGNEKRKQTRPGNDAYFDGFATPKGACPSVGLLVHWSVEKNVLARITAHVLNPVCDILNPALLVKRFYAGHVNN